MTCSTDGKNGAAFSECGNYRYALWRRWDAERPTVTFVMLNPSTADAWIDDQTIKLCVGFAKSWRFGGLMVGNLFAWRATKPRDLKAASRAGEDVIGPCNDEALEAMARDPAKVVAAWGNNGALQGRSDTVHEMFAGRLHMLKLSKIGQPRHPIGLSRKLKPCLWI